MQFSDAIIDVAKAKSFMSRWSNFDLTLEQFTAMLGEASSWCNIPLSVIMQVTKFECGYPNRTFGRNKVNPYSSTFHASPNFVGPFQMSNTYLAGVRQNQSNELYRGMEIPSDIRKCSLGQQFYFSIADKIRLSRMKVKGRDFGHAPLNAATIYGLHLRPELLASILRTTFNFNIKMPARVYSGQSAEVDRYFKNVTIATAPVTI